MIEINQLKENIENEIAMVRELYMFIERAEYASPSEERIFIGMINSLKRRIKILNDSLPEMINSLSLTKKLPYSGDVSEAHDKIKPIKIDSRTGFVIKEKDKEEFLKELNISRNLLKKLKKAKLIEKTEFKGYKKPSIYARISNKFFLGVAETWIRRDKFKSLSFDLRRSNIKILTTTYISMMFFSVFLSIFLGFFLLVFLLFFNVGLDLPFVRPYDGSYGKRFLNAFWVIFAVPILTALSFYFFPGAEKRSLEKKINQELPFMVIHMASISGSGIEPSEIFRIIGLSREYKYVRGEIRKIINQINIYGYDITNALRNVAMATPSTKLSELLNGMSVTITSGGDIKTFFEKRAESLLLQYRLEREKFSKTAETFMDIYISIVIAAPMILLMLLVMMSVSGLQTGFSINQMTIAIIGIVAIVNIVFLTFLHLNEPEY